jgi:hypothetical protein
MTPILTTWTALKSLSISKNIGFQYIDEDRMYRVFLPDVNIIFGAEVLKGTDDCIDFETNYKSLSNRNVSQLSTPFASKIFGNKKLFARNTGIQAALTAGSNEITYTCNYPWVKIVGLEAINGEALDKAELRVYDSSAGTYSGVPNALLNQFGFNLNIAPNYYIRTSSFDADLYLNMVLKITYISVSNKTVGINILMDELK